MSKDYSRREWWQKVVTCMSAKFAVENVCRARILGIAGLTVFLASCTCHPIESERVQRDDGRTESVRYANKAEPQQPDMLFDFVAADRAESVLCEEIPSTAHSNLKIEGSPDKVTKHLDLFVEIRIKSATSTNVNFLRLKREIGFEVASGRRGWLELCMPLNSATNDGSQSLSYGIRTRSEPAPR